jgi:hypothetical protein
MLRRCRPPIYSPISSRLQVAKLSSRRPRFVKIGDLEAQRNVAKREELVPSGYLPSQLRDLPPETLRHLRWMLQKDRLLRQDMFLIGAAGPHKRVLAQQYCQLLNR